MRTFYVPASLHYFLVVEGLDLEDAKRRFVEEPSHVRYLEEEEETVHWSGAFEANEEEEF